MSSVAAVSDALVEWATDVCPELQGAYDHATERKTEPLPDVATEIIETAIVTGDDPRFPAYSGLQQFVLKVYEFNLLIMVDPEPAEAAAENLSTLVDRLIDSVLDDMTLGGTLAAFKGIASPQVRAGYNPPFVQFDDGTKGRLATLTINIAEPKGLG